MQGMTDLPPNLDFYEGNAMDCTVGWLRKRTAEATLRFQKLGSNVMFDWQKEEDEDLGEIPVSWCASFAMPDHDDKNTWTKLRDINAETKIPLQAWQMAHELWKYGFHIKYTFSMSGFYLHLLIGLPYKTLLEEAEKMNIILRLSHTKGRQTFRTELIPRFPRDISPDNTCFSSAHRQGLTLFRMKRLPVILPEVAMNLDGKEKLHKHVKRYHKRGIPIRSFLLQRYFKAMGAYRPHGHTIFGTLIKRCCTEVLENPWLVVRDEAHKDMDETPHLLNLTGTESASHADIGQVIDIFEEWLQKDEAKEERFEGQFAAFFALHDKQKLQILRDGWATFKFLSRIKWEAKSPEFATNLSYYHPHNLPENQFGLVYQPLDEIRDYFGDHIGLYFAWLGHYTKALIFPTMFGIIAMLTQVFGPASDGINPVADNLLTIPYSIFFAMWSVTFLSSWTQRQNELRFLWGSENFEVNERTRPQFKGQHLVNQETGREMMHHENMGRRAVKLGASFAISFTCIFLTAYLAVEATAVKSWGKWGGGAYPACAVLPSNVTYTDCLNDVWQPEGVPQVSMVDKQKFKILSSVLNLALIFISGTMYEAVAMMLTNWENHRTNTNWEDSKIVKNFLFQFINNYFVLFYIAYIRPFKEPATRTPFVSTMEELQMQLLIVFTGKTLIKQSMSMIKPIMARRSKLNKIITNIMSDGHHVVGKLEAMQIAAAGVAGKAMEIQKHAAQKQQDAQDAISDRNKKSANPGSSSPARAPAQEPEPEPEFTKAGPERTNSSGSALDDDRYVINTNDTELYIDQDIQITDDEIAEVASQGIDLLSAVPSFTGMTKAEIKVVFFQMSERDDSVEDEFILEDFDSTFDDFNEAAIQYGYLAIFAPAYPLAAFFAFVKNIFDLRNDAASYCYNMRRPQWKQCEDIGSWFGVLNVIGFFAVVTNATMVCFVGSQLVTWQDEDERTAEKDMMIYTHDGHPRDDPHCHTYGYNSTNFDFMYKEYADGELLRASPASLGGGDCLLTEGIWVRVFSQRLWMFSVMVEHVVMMMRVVIAKFSPEIPEWTEDARDVLKFRTSKWDSDITKMYALDKTLEEVQVALGSDKPKPMKKPHADLTLKGFALLTKPVKMALQVNKKPSNNYIPEHEHEGIDEHEFSDNIGRFSLEDVQEEEQLVENPTFDDGDTFEAETAIAPSGDGGEVLEEAET
jgi:hypothetical protein